MTTGRLPLACNDSEAALQVNQPELAEPKIAPQPLPGQPKRGGTMARPKKKAPGPHIYWRTGSKVSLTHTEGARAYADFRAYSDVGGERMALAEPGSSWGTTDPDIAGVLFEAELSRLQAKKKGRVGVPTQEPTTLARLVEHHLVMKAKADISRSHLLDLETRLRSHSSSSGGTVTRHPSPRRRCGPGARTSRRTGPASPVPCVTT